MTTRSTQSEPSDFSTFIRQLLALGAVFSGVILVGTAPSHAEWTHSGGDIQGSGHVSGVGAITGLAGELPGTSSIVQSEASDFRVPLFTDTNGDGQVEALRVFQGRLGAFDVGNGQPLWMTPSMGITTIKEVADVNGDGLAQEVVVVSTGMAGGVHVIDLPSGSLQDSFTELEGNSGVRADELFLEDVDGDGADELIFNSALLFTPEMYVVDFSTSDGETRVASSALQGYYLQTNRLAVGDFDGDGTANEIVTLQADWLDLKRVCAPTAPEASCDEVDGTLCLCHVAVVEDAFAARVFDSPQARDVDGDGVTELVTVHSYSTHGRGFGAIQLGEYFSGNPSPNLGGWLYEYSVVPTLPSPDKADGDLRDLNGDGSLELVVSVSGPTVGEVGLDGNVVEDGLDNPDGSSLGVFDGADGQLLASMDDAVAHGYIDLDGDGEDEVVVERIGAGGLGDGGVGGWKLQCTGVACELVQVWSAPTHRVTRFPEGSGPLELPRLSVFRVLDPQGAEQGLLLWTENRLEHLSYDGAGGVSVGGSFELDPDHRIAGVRDLGDEVMVNREGVITLYSGALKPRAEFSSVLSGRSLRWMSGALDPQRSHSGVILDGHVFFELGELKELTGAEHLVSDQVALLADIDGDGITDVFGVDDAEELGGPVVSRFEYDAALGEFVELWSWESNGLESPVAGMDFRSLWSFTHGDFNGDLIDDIAFSMEKYPAAGIVVLDGVSGELLNSSAMTIRDSQWAPMLIGDFSSSEGYGVSDGALDLLRPSRLALEAWVPGDEEPVATRNNEVQHLNFLFGDLDGDGADDLLMGRLWAVNDPALEAVSLDGALTTMWGPVTDLEPPPGTSQAIALATLDSAPGRDVLVLSSSGGLDGRAGTTGERLTGFPIFLGLGEEIASPSTTKQAQPLRALVSLDVDGDGHDEAVVGASDGYVYAVDVAQDDPKAPGLLWSWFGGGAPIESLAASDVDGDSQLEILVSSSDGSARVIDGLGVSVEILQPAADDCLETTTFFVCGSSNQIDYVDVLVQGLPRAQELEINEDGSWCGEVSVPAVEALIEIVAVAWRGGIPVASDQLFIASNLDEDLDGITVCGGDCDDNNPDVAPGLPEACDGLDNDCDPSTDETEDADGDGATACDGDCDDGEERVSPVGIEDCEDGLDNDCDGAIDTEDSDCGGGVAGGAENNCCDSDGCSTALSWEPGQVWAMPLRSLLWVGAGLLFLRRRSRG